MTDTLEAIAGDMLDLLNDWQFWVIGLDSDNTPRLGFTQEECDLRFSEYPTSGKLEDMKLEVEAHKPKCEVCGNISTIFIKDFTYYRYQGEMWIYKNTIETHFYCEDHTRETKSEIIFTGYR